VAMYSLLLPSGECSTEFMRRYLRCIGYGSTAAAREMRD